MRKYLVIDEGRVVLKKELGYNIINQRRISYEENNYMFSCIIVLISFF